MSMKCVYSIVYYCVSCLSVAVGWVHVNVHKTSLYVQRTCMLAAIRCVGMSIKYTCLLNEVYKSDMLSVVIQIWIVQETV